MNKREFNKLVEELWERYASPDRHGYKDLMRRDAFSDALAEAIAIREADSPT